MSNLGLNPETSISQPLSSQLEAGNGKGRPDWTINLDVETRNTPFAPHIPPPSRQLELLVLQERMVHEAEGGKELSLREGAKAHHRNM